MAHQRVNRASCQGLLHRASLAVDLGLPQRHVLSPSPFLMSVHKQSQREGSACQRGEGRAGHARTPEGLSLLQEGKISAWGRIPCPTWLGAARFTGRSLQEISTHGHPLGSFLCAPINPITCAPINPIPLCTH